MKPVQQMEIQVSHLAKHERYSTLVIRFFCIQICLRKNRQANGFSVG